MHLFCIISRFLTILNAMKCSVEACFAVLLRSYYKKKGLYVFTTEYASATM